MEYRKPPKTRRQLQLNSLPMRSSNLLPLRKIPPQRARTKLQRRKATSHPLRRYPRQPRQGTRLQNPNRMDTRKMHRHWKAPLQALKRQRLGREADVQRPNHQSLERLQSQRFLREKIAAKRRVQPIEILFQIKWQQLACMPSHFRAFITFYCVHR